MNTYKFPVGDWSGDGHEACEWYMVKTNASIEDVREAHFSCKEKLGFEIGTIASEYQDNTVDEHIIKILFENKIVTEDDFCEVVEGDDGKTMYTVESEDIFHIWLKILNYLNPTLKLVHAKKAELPTINFYGWDEKGRHLETPGYGVFYC
jgi:hypothetical protein